MNDASPVLARKGELPVFISWSMSLAREVAGLLSEWLDDVVPGIKPWFSDKDIEVGKRWQAELFNSLGQSTVGIIVVTPANQSRQWLNFEAGCLASTIEPSGGVVMPLLVNMDLSDLSGTPLGELQAVTFGEDGVWRIVKAIYDRTGSDMTAKMLKSLFDLNWDSLRVSVEDAIARAVAADAADARPAKRDVSLVLEDVLTEVRELSRQVGERVGVSKTAFSRTFRPKLRTDSEGFVVDDKGQPITISESDLSPRRKFQWSVEPKTLPIDFDVTQTYKLKSEAMHIPLDTPESPNTPV